MSWRNTEPFNGTMTFILPFPWTLLWLVTVMAPFLELLGPLELLAKGRDPSIRIRWRVAANLQAGVTADEACSTVPNADLVRSTFCPYFISDVSYS